MARETRPNRAADLGTVDRELMERYRKDAEVAKVRSRASGGGDRAQWLRFEEGPNMARILPPLTPGNPFYLYVGQHFQLGPTSKGVVYCPERCLWVDGKTLMADWDCPICEYVEVVKQRSKKDSDLLHAKNVQVSGQWICQALDQMEGDGVVRLWTMGPMIYNQVMEYLTGKYPDLYLLEGGYDLNVKKTKGKNKTDYQVYPEKDPSDVDPEITKDMLDLEEYVSTRIMSKDELERVLSGEDPMDVVNSRTADNETSTPKGREPEPARGRGVREPEPVRGRGTREPDPEPRGRGRGREPEPADERPAPRGRREPEPDEPRGSRRAPVTDPEPDDTDDAAQREMDRLRDEARGERGGERGRERPAPPRSERSSRR